MVVARTTKRAMTPAAASWVPGDTVRRFLGRVGIRGRPAQVVVTMVDWMLSVTACAFVAICLANYFGE